MRWLRPCFWVRGGRIRLPSRRMSLAHSVSTMALALRSKEMLVTLGSCVDGFGGGRSGLGMLSCEGDGSGFSCAEGDGLEGATGMSSPFQWYAMRWPSRKAGSVLYDQWFGSRRVAFVGISPPWL